MRGESVDTGVFECTLGSYRRSVKEAEVMHFLKGAGSFTPDGEETLEFRVGDTFFLKPIHTQLGLFLNYAQAVRHSEVANVAKRCRHGPSVSRWHVDGRF
ncbi:cupin domain-containing protein [Pseudomonas bijieensis]